MFFIRKLVDKLRLDVQDLKGHIKMLVEHKADSQELIELKRHIAYDLEPQLERQRKTITAILNNLGLKKEAQPERFEVIAKDDLSA